MTGIRASLAEIRALASTDGPPGADHMQEIAAAVRSMPRNQRSFQTLASRSYLHGNGFARVLLVTYDDASVELALHYWPVTTPERARRQSRHSHRADYVSTVLRGVLCEDLYEESDLVQSRSAIDRVAVYGSVPRRGPAARQLPLLRVSYLSSLTAHHHRLGHTYSRLAESIHNAYALKADSLTICLSAEKRTRALVFYPFDDTPGYTSRPTPTVPLNRIAEIFELL